MYTTHLLLGCLWQFDRKVKHEGFKNKYSLENDEKTFTHVPLSLIQIYEDQLKPKKKGRAESSEQPYDDVRKSENHGILKRIVLYKMEKDKVLTERREKKEMVRKEGCEKKNQEASWFLYKKGRLRQPFFMTYL